MRNNRALNTLDLSLELCYEFKKNIILAIWENVLINDRVKHVI
jgi:hypothetical protein